MSRDVHQLDRRQPAGFGRLPHWAAVLPAPQPLQPQRSHHSGLKHAPLVRPSSKLWRTMFLHLDTPRGTADHTPLGLVIAQPSPSTCTPNGATPLRTQLSWHADPGRASLCRHFTSLRRASGNRRATPLAVQQQRPSTIASPPRSAHGRVSHAPRWTLSPPAAGAGATPARACRQRVSPICQLIYALLLDSHPRLRLP